MRCLLAVGLLISLCGCSHREPVDEANQYASKASRALEKKAYVEAKTMALKAHGLKPEVAEYCVAVAFASIKLNEQGDAKDYYNQALAILERESQTDPDRVDDCAIVIVFLGRRDAARAALDSGINRFPEAANLREVRNDFDEWCAELSEYAITTAQ